MEYPYRRLSYIQVQAPDPNKKVIVSFSVRPFKVEEGLVIDAPISDEVSITHELTEGEVFKSAQEYLLSLVPYEGDGE